MKLQSQKRIAGAVLGCSPKRVWCNPDALETIKESITKSDIRKLISNGTIIQKQKKGVSRGRARIYAIAKKKGRHKGHGSKKGKVGSRFDSKRKWIENIRNQRGLLFLLRDKNRLSKEHYLDLYYKAKGGYFRSMRHLKLYMTEHAMVKKQ